MVGEVKFSELRNGLQNEGIGGTVSDQAASVSSLVTPGGPPLDSDTTIDPHGCRAHLTSNAAVLR